MLKAEAKMLYLNRTQVEQLCQEIDTVEAMRDVFHMHGLKQTILPEEAYLSWTNHRGEPVRSLNMPGYLGGTLHVAGTKIINGNTRNPERGLPRASGLTMLYNDTTGQVMCLMEAAYLSSLRTASVTALAAKLFQGPPVSCMALIGAGALARAHIDLLVKTVPQLQRILVYDLNRERVEMLHRDVADLLDRYHIILHETLTAEEAIRPAQLIIPVTTVTTGYIRFEWLAPGSILINISLDDPLPEVVLRASIVAVDDWELVRSDSKRLLGRMYREGRLLGPGERGEVLPPACRRVDMQLGELVAGMRTGRQSPEDIILVNPFGLSLEDIVLAALVYQKALERNVGVWLEH